MLAEGGSDQAALEACGFFVCTADLEDELIRAAGAAAVQQICDMSGDPRGRGEGNVP